MPNDPQAVADMHPSTFITEELAVRGWSRVDLAIAMGGDAGKNLLMLDVYSIVGPTDPRMRIGQPDAERLAKAFDVSSDYFLNLEAAWRKLYVH